MRSAQRREPRLAGQPLPHPLVWTFDGRIEACLADAEDTLRRAIQLVGDVSRIAVVVDLGLPALKRQVDAGDALQPEWSRFVERIGRYGLPAAPRVRPVRGAAPLLTLIVAYRH
jgi:hypothetical protein